MGKYQSTQEQSQYIRKYTELYRMISDKYKKGTEIFYCLYTTYFFHNIKRRCSTWSWNYNKGSIWYNRGEKNIKAEPLCHGSHNYRTVCFVDWQHLNCQLMMRMQINEQLVCKSNLDWLYYPTTICNFIPKPNCKRFYPIQSRFRIIPTQNISVFEPIQPWFWISFPFKFPARLTSTVNVFPVQHTEE